MYVNMYACNYLPMSIYLSACLSIHLSFNGYLK